MKGLRPIKVDKTINFVMRPQYRSNEYYLGKYSIFVHILRQKASKVECFVNFH